jgi:WD40 repeat protein
VAALIGVLALTPAGAAVHRWIDQTLGVRHARPALFSLPASGRLLISGPGGAWTVGADGAKRRLGPWRQATWSPHAIYVAVAAGNELTTVDLRGTPQWSIARPGVRFPRWFSPNGYRLAYLSATSLRVIVGNGTGDRRLAGQVASIAPAWRPGHDYQLAYATVDGSVVVRDADTARTVWSRRPPAPARGLDWSADGTRLLVLTRRGPLVFDDNGHQLAWSAMPPDRVPLDAALSPDGRAVALLSNRDVTVTALPPQRSGARRIFSGEGLRQLTWSPDGQWLLVSWPAADQWIFIHAAGRPRIIAVSRIAEQFTPAGERPAFPHLDGWCCGSAGGPG